MRLMQRLRRFSHFKPFLGYVLVVMVILSSAWLLGRHSLSKSLQQSSEPADQLRSELSELSNAANGLALSDGKQDTVSSAMTRTAAVLEKSLNSAKEVAPQLQNKLDTELYNQILASLDKQQAYFNTYKQHMYIAGKAIAYNPSLDLDKLNPEDSEEADQLVSRATSARDNLSKLDSPQSINGSLGTESLQLSSITKSNLELVVDCFDRLAYIARSNKAKTVRADCKRLYPSFRQTLVNDVVAVYNSQQAKEDSEVLTELAARL